MSLSSLKKAWELDEIRWTAFDRSFIPERLVHVVSTTALVESRADMYADYLLSVFAARPQWSELIRRWNLEEQQHGQSLRRWAELVNPGFNFSALFENYLSKVEYHAHTGQSVRGSLRDELVSRCTVEALASGYYAALHDATSEPLLKEICARLRQDEARHFAMFYGFLAEEGRVPLSYFPRAMFVCLKRIAELDDEQIIYASFCAGDYSCWHSDRMAAWANYFAHLMNTYKWSHAHYICGLLLKIFDLPRGTLLHRMISTTLLVLVKCKLLASQAILAVLTLFQAPAAKKNLGKNLGG